MFNIIICWKNIQEETVFTSSCFVYALLAENVPYAFPGRLIWELQGPQECFDITVSAWNSAGEGPKGKPVTCCWPSTPPYQPRPYMTTGAFSYEIDEKCHRPLKPSIVLWLTFSQGSREVTNKHSSSNVNKMFVQSNRVFKNVLKTLYIFFLKNSNFKCSYFYYFFPDISLNIQK